MNSIFPPKTSYSDLFNTIDIYQKKRGKLLSLVYQTIKLFHNLSETSNGEIVKYFNLDSLNDLIRNLGAKENINYNSEDAIASSEMENPVIVVLGKKDAGKSTFIKVLLKSNELLQSVDRNVRFCYSKDGCSDSDREENLEHLENDLQTSNLIRCLVSAKFLKSGIDLMEIYEAFSIVDLSNLLRNIHLSLVIYIIKWRPLLQKAEISYLRELKKSYPKLDIMFFITHLDKTDESEINTKRNLANLAEYKMAQCFKQLQSNKIIPTSFENWSDCPYFHGASLKYIKSYQDSIKIRNTEIQYHFYQFSRFQSALFDRFSNVFTNIMLEFCDCLLDFQMEISTKIINFTQNFVDRLKENMKHLEFIESIESKMYSKIKDATAKPELERQSIEYLNRQSNDIFEPIQALMYPLYLEIPDNGIVDDPTIIDECINAIRNLLIHGIESVLKDLMEKEIFDNYHKNFVEKFNDRNCLPFPERLADKRELSPYQLVIERKLNKNYNLGQSGHSSDNSNSGMLNEFMDAILSSIKTYLKDFPTVEREGEDANVNSTEWKMNQAKLLLKECDHHLLGEEICNNLYHDFEIKHKAFRKVIESETFILQHNIGESDEKRMNSIKNVPSLYTLFLRTLNIKGKYLFKDVSVSDKIGQNRGSKVYKCLVKNQEMLLKKIDLTIYPMEKIAEEIFYSLQFSHANLLTTFGIVLKETEKVLQIFRPKMTFNLECYILKNVLNLETKFNISKQIACGLKYLHDHGIMHRGLKLTNILINEDKHVVLAEYGFCKSEALSQSSFIGKAIHIAPEIIKSALYNKKIDIYAFGFLLWHIFEGTGKRPQNSMYDRSTNQIIWKNSNFDFNLRPENMDSFPKVVWKLMSKCWCTDPACRPGIDEITEELKEIS